MNPATLDRAGALAILNDAGGHAYLWPDVGRRIGAAFGLNLTPERRRNQPNEFKGLSVPGVKDGEVVEGFSVYVLAVAIAESLPDPLDRTYRVLEGRGSRARAACEAIAEHLARGQS